MTFDLLEEAWRRVLRMRWSALLDGGGRLWSHRRTRRFLVISSLAVALALNFWALAVPQEPLLLVPAAWNKYAVSTAALLVVMGVMLVVWPLLAGAPAAPEPPTRRFMRLLAAVVAAGAGLWLVAVVAQRWSGGIAQVPIDPARADMLPLIDAALERATAGLNPYVMYTMPWELPLSYGPWLWGAFLPAFLLDADLRAVTMFGQLFVPTVVIVAAAVRAWSGSVLEAALLLGLAAAALFSPLLHAFVTFGHTPAYWPLLAAFALLVHAGAYRGAAVALGTLIVFRSLYVALAPLLLLHVWRQDRRQAIQMALLIGVCAALPFVPFLLLDWRMVYHGMYGTYEKVIKEFVWAQTTNAVETVGLTRVLLERGLERYVEISGVVALLAVYGASWVAMKRGVWLAGPWMCLALLAICMTTLWPVWYIFLDVFVLGVAFFAVEVEPRLARRKGAVMAAASAAALLVTVVVLGGN